MDWSDKRPLDDLAFDPRPFVAISDYVNPIVVNSSVMAWTSSPETERIYTDFTPAVMDRLRGDQDWFHVKMAGQDRFPRRWVPSYKAHVRPTGRVPADARVVVFHGRPKPWEVPALVACERAAA